VPDATDPLPEPTLVRWMALLERRPVLLYVVALGLIGLVAFADFLTGDEVLLYVFQLAPVAILAWCAGLYAGLAGTVVATGAVLVTYVALAGGQLRTLQIWQAAVTLTTNGVVAWVVTRLKQSRLRVLGLLETERRSAREDPLTGLASVRAFRERLRLEVDRMRRHATPLSLLFLDLDDFKHVNDQRGHGAGDETLSRVGRLLHALTRKIDLCGRVGGDEFAVLMPETGSDDAIAVANRVREGVVKPFAEGGAGIGVSVGVGTFLTPPLDEQIPMDRCDRLMYEAKKAGKNRVEHREFP
jgi:diguanylate cyclase (GGDEF)-like protein